MQTYDIVIIGAGPAGLASAVSAKRSGIDSILILERSDRPGGILNQCIHNGFGLHTFHEELTGPEYAGRFIRQADELGIECRFGTMVTGITQGETLPAGDSRARSSLVITAVSASEGLIQIRACAVILAMGCRERPRGALNIPGYRPAGIFSAGTAQKLVNMEGYMPGREVVILGSGDIGLIMARRMTLEGARVHAVAEIMPYSGGLKRNIVQCLDDFCIPLLLSHTVTRIHGKNRVEGVTLSRVDEKRRPIPGTEKYFPCDTLLLSVGLIPENELSRSLVVNLNPATSGPLVNERFETSVPGVFACGNVLHVHDLVDYVSEEAASAGTCAAEYVKEQRSRHCPSAGAEDVSVPGQMIPLTVSSGIRYTVPAYIRPEKMPERLTVRFRVTDVYRDCHVCVYFDDIPVFRKQRRIVTPGEMEEIRLEKTLFDRFPRPSAIRFCLEPRQEDRSPDARTDCTASPVTAPAPSSASSSSASSVQLTCIRCPLGCNITVELEGETIRKISGNTCPRGAEYAEKEVTAPVRTVTSTVKIKNGMLKMLPVKTQTDIPKEKVFDCIRALKNVSVQAPVHTGDVILPDAGETGVPVTAETDVSSVPGGAEDRKDSR